MSRLEALGGDLELLAKEEELDEITLLMGDLDIAMNEGRLSAEEREEKLEELKAMDEEARSGEVFKRLQQVCNDLRI